MQAELCVHALYIIVFSKDAPSADVSFTRRQRFAGMIILYDFIHSTLRQRLIFPNACAARAPVFNVASALRPCFFSVVQKNRRTYYQWRQRGLSIAIAQGVIVFSFFFFSLSRYV